MTKHEKTIEQQFKVLSEIEHVRARVGMWAGSPVMETKEEFVFDNGAMTQKPISSVPAFIKIVSEVIDNSVDEHKRNPDRLNILKVDIGSDDPDEIIVYDNGGIPVKIHEEFGKYVPEIIFGQLRSGSNYNDEEDQATIGTNGLGAKLTNILSQYFIIETCDGVNSFRQEYSDGMNKRSEPKIRAGSKNHTKITFKPDYEFFKMQHLDADHRDKIIKRLYDVAACNPNLKVYVNGERIQVNSFKDYVALYTNDYVYDENDDWKVAVAHSSGFQQTSFVNAVETYMGGTHVDYVINQITAQLREYFKKKHKVDVKPGDIRAHIHLFISCNINRPKFSSQSKENMISAVSDFKTSFEVTDKFIRKIVASPIIQSVLDWVMAKEAAAQAAELRKLNKDTDRANLRKIEKFTDANEKQDRSKCMLFMTEGLSAASSVISARDPKLIGVYPMRGKFINVEACDNKKLMENQEFVDFLAIMGLKIGQKVESVEQLRFGKIVFCSDQDGDGAHIKGLLTTMIKKFWPELLHMGLVYQFVTPIRRVFIGKKTIDFFSNKDYDEWVAKNPDVKFTNKYYKGLGTSTANDFRGYFNDMDRHLIQLTVEDEHDIDVIDLVYGKDIGAAERRKEWLQLM